MAYTAPSVLMGKPEDTEGFEAFAVDEIVIYMAKDVLEEELKDNSLYIYLEGYGKYKFEISE